ncbi:8-amino-7-oxononanoate synthase [Streptomyces sp. MST-110588]|uniref:8-amino-7-oxononanoate synthase n=1 Tax=Streptomyces sp. MST-110588 TaxID=2833628 RepID=UPI001F5C8654|nr:8-amino-7-oxononanoate synthase [Streptomyces sp. MST-110588]UNO38613.1 8-amino-7-oxononanoate synthase [Streptomyces sp. MST-110588]
MPQRPVPPTPRNAPFAAVEPALSPDASAPDASAPESSPPGPDAAFGWIDEAREQRRRAGLLRTLRPRPVNSPLLDLAGNDYLGLCRHPEVIRGAAQAAHRWGAGATGSRLVTGSTELHARLESELAAFCGFEAALVLSCGYTANLAAVTALTGPGTLIVSDAGNHASLIDGCRLSRARTAVVPHADPDAVRKSLDGHTGRALAVTDSVFSVDGDAAPLPELAAACRTHGAALLVDDAHGLGVLGDGGRGAPYTAGLAGDADVVATVTLSKSLGSQGGAVLGPARVIEHLVNTARTFIFDTGLAPAAAGAALAALRLLRREPWRAARARTVARELHRRLSAAGLGAVRPDAAVISVRAPSPEQAVRWAADCREAGLAVGCFRPPSVPDGISRLRLTARADLSDRRIEEAVGTIVRTAPTAAWDRRLTI